MRFDVLTLHPELVNGPLSVSVLGRAVSRGVIEIGIHDIRDSATDRHRTVDEAPYGGGAGMVLKVDVIARAIAAIRRPDSWVVLTSPSGTPFTQAMAVEFAQRPHVVLVAGHYEGVDARVEALVDQEVSLGDFVLTGGEIAAAAIVDATARLVPGVLGNEASVVDESFAGGLLEYPQYTRPRNWNGTEVPEVLISGHHSNVEEWRRNQAEARTRRRRPDLWEQYVARCEGRGVDEPGSKE